MLAGRSPARRFASLTRCLRRSVTAIFGSSRRSASGFANLATALGVPGVAQWRTLDDTYKQSSNNWALFTHNIFDITDQFSLTVGARYTHEKKKLSVDLRRQ